MPPFLVRTLFLPCTLLSTSSHWRGKEGGREGEVCLCVVGAGWGEEGKREVKKVSVTFWCLFLLGH